MPLVDTYPTSFFAKRARPIYPAKDSHSEILPYNQLDHAWNDEYWFNSSLNEKTWNESSPNGMPLVDTYPTSFITRKIYPAKDSHSEILPYNQLDHAWNDE
jgi:hypothetical protein